MTALDCIIAKHPLPWRLDKALTDANGAIVLEASPGEDLEIFAMYAAALTEGAELSVRFPGLERNIARRGDTINALHLRELKHLAACGATAAARDCYERQLLLANATTVARGAARASVDPIFKEVRAWVHENDWNLAKCELAMRDCPVCAKDWDHLADILSEFEAGALAVAP